MVFIRKKVSNGKTYHQVVESYRPEGSKTPRQKVLLYLGKHPTIDSALARCQEEIDSERGQERSLRERHARGERHLYLCTTLEVAEKHARKAELAEERAAQLRELAQSIKPSQPQ